MRLLKQRSVPSQLQTQFLRSRYLLFPTLKKRAGIWGRKAARSRLVGALIDCGIKADCLARDLDFEWSALRVWMCVCVWGGSSLGDPRPYLRKFRRELWKMSNGLIDKRHRGVNLTPPVYDFWVLYHSVTSRAVRFYLITGSAYKDQQGHATWKKSSQECK